jgi:hypothetical protein
MKIQSRYKDYYDYVAHAYGGGDERVTYVREPLKDEFTVITTDSNPNLPSPRLDELMTRIKWLAINGRVYTMVAVKDDYSVGDYQLFTEDNFGAIIDDIEPKYRWKWTSRQSVNWEKYFGVENEVVTVISRVIRQPVFMIESARWDWKERHYKIVLDKNIPNLAKQGISSHIQPEQMYQDIAYYVSNKMVDSPDLMVNDNMTDKEKIVQHGFDLKQSFRHRK